MPPTPAVAGCTTCNQATGAAGSTCSATAACSFAIVPSMPLPTACECNTPGAAATPATAAPGANCADILCQPAPRTCVCTSDAVAPTGAGCASLLAIVTTSPTTPGRELACVRKPPAGCVSSCFKRSATDVGVCTAGTTSACTWAIVVKAPAVACKCSAVNEGATTNTTVPGAVCPAGTLCTAPSAVCPCTDAATIPYGAGCPPASGTSLSCARTPPPGCASCTATGNGAGTGSV